MDFNPDNIVIKRKAPPKLVTTEQIVARAVAEDVLEKKLTNLKEEIRTQKNISWQIVIGVAIAFIFALGVLVYDGISSRQSNIERFSSVNGEIQKQSASINNLQNDVKNIKIRNPYLK